MTSQDHPELPMNATTTQLQAYIADVVKYRGFDKDSVSDNFIMLCEEIGELAKALRIYNGVKVAADSSKVNLEYEIADVFWLLTCVSNQLGVDIEKAVRNKEEVNKRRVWVNGQSLN